MIQLNLGLSQGLLSNGAYIVSGATSQIVLTQGADFIMQDYNSNPGTILLSGSTYLAGDLLNNSASTSILSDGTGTVYLNGSSEQSVGGTTAIDLKKLDIANDALLSADLSITENLHFTSGIIRLVDQDLTMIYGSTVTDFSSSNFVNAEEDGSLIMYAVSSGSQIVFPVGTSTSYSPAMVSLTSGSSQYFNVSLLDGVWSDGTTGTNLALTDPLVDRTWIVYSDQIHEVDLVIQWNATDEVNAFERTTAFSSAYSSVWNSASTTVSGSDPYTVTYSALTDLTSTSVRAVSAEAKPLAVDLIYFRGTALEKSNLISWATASEENSNYFELFKSRDNINFKSAFVEKSHGNSTVSNTYQVEDFDEIDGTTYYQLHEVDFNGQVKVYETISVNRSNSPIKVYQNNSNLIVELANNQSKNVDISLYDLSGRLVLSNKLYPNIDQVAVEIDISTIAKGIYLIRIMDDSKQVHSAKLIVI